MNHISINQRVLSLGAHKKLYAEILVVFAVLLISISFFFINSRFLWPIVVDTRDKIFGADTSDIINLIRQVTFDEDTRKHLLFSATISPIAGSFQQFLGLNENRSIRLSMALLAALNVTGVFIFLRKYLSATLPALLFVCFYAFLFANLVIFSIPETYSLSNLTILVYVSALYMLRNTLNWRHCILLSAFAGFASLYNPPLLSLMIIHLLMVFLQGDLKRWGMITVSNLAIGVSIFLFANYQVYASKFINFIGNYMDKWASIHNLLDLTKILDVIANFFFYSILSPVDHLPGRLGLKDWTGYGKSLTYVLLIFLIGWFLGYAIYIALAKKHGNQGFAISLLVWIFSMTIFYTYFNPRDAILYSSQILFPLLILFANAFETIKMRPSVKFTAFLCCLLLIAINNCLTLYNGVK